MQATNDFNKSIKELNYLTDLSKNIDLENVNDSNTVVKKAIVLLLCAKLERFVKDITNEYIHKILDKKLKSNNVPLGLKKEIYKMEINLINTDFDNYFRTNKNKKYLRNFSLFWDDNYIINELRDDFSISISNNGTTEFRKIFKRIGFKDMLDDIPDFTTSEEDVCGVSTIQSFPIINRIDSMISKRHKIIHDDENPNLTNSEIDIYINVVKMFTENVDKKFEESLEKL